MRKQGFLQISFPWLFAIIVGIFILFLTIYGVTKLIKTEQTIQDVKTSKEIGILLNPLETGFEEAKSSSLTFPVNTRIINFCSDFGEFGKQTIQVSQESFNKWTQTNINVDFLNKYIFSEDFVEGKKAYIFSKPFDFPFKVTDLLYITSSNDRYCFVNAPEDIEDELKNINQENLLVENCSEDIQVCFSDEDCEIFVNYAQKYVEKNNEKMYFEGDALMYAAIFSEKDIYECQIKRIMKRLVNLAELYKEKAEFIAIRDCETNLNEDLSLLASSAENLENSNDLFALATLAEDIGRKNKENSLCRLW